MHPQFKQTPPKLSFSTIAVFNPNWDALIAVTYPPDHYLKLLSQISYSFLLFMKLILAEFTQYLLPVEVGPSSNT